ncbi:hypothetical protein OBBRIDRAFT_791962 [Obba rivulosa]|uniref:PUB domain-containing protein n=1 Tax=Obba rivulosa TaxID=1052685 RepID=A0A8E2DKQ3_9APHY|nr:hypothetical protein OBBRIDRAFT_791962 [Obba rivulosa]
MSSRAGRAAVAAAAERRLRQERADSLLACYTPFDENHGKRQEFRRVIDRDILESNARDLALEALATLLTLAENILQSPGKEKLCKFRPSNPKIKRIIIESKGALQYAILLGFREEAMNYETYYRFHKKDKSDLHVGASMLREALQREKKKDERGLHDRGQEQRAAEVAKANIRQAFLDDRKNKAILDRKEKQCRLAGSAGSRDTPEPRGASMESRACRGKIYTLHDLLTDPSGDV